MRNCIDNLLHTFLLFERFSAFWLSFPSSLTLNVRKYCAIFFFFGKQQITILSFLAIWSDWMQFEPFGRKMSILDIFFLFTNVTWSLTFEFVVLSIKFTLERIIWKHFSIAVLYFFSKLLNLNSFSHVYILKTKYSHNYVWRQCVFFSILLFYSFHSNLNLQIDQVYAEHW